jgi:hypothetical protein
MTYTLAFLAGIWIVIGIVIVAIAIAQPDRR